MNLLDEANLSMRDSERLFENLIAEIKESKTKSRNKLEAINDDLRYNRGRMYGRKSRKSSVHKKCSVTAC